jgi:hypothetical protein
MTPVTSALVLGAISASGINTPPSVVVARRLSDTHCSLATARMANHRRVLSARGRAFLENICDWLRADDAVARAKASGKVSCAVLMLVRGF